MIVMTENALLTLEEVAHMLRVSIKTVKKYIVLGRIEAIQVGNRYRVRQEALERYLARNTRPEADQK
jgi:excisionase family DNA binding protein